MEPVFKLMYKTFIPGISCARVLLVLAMAGVAFPAPTLEQWENPCGGSNPVEDPLPGLSASAGSTSKQPLSVSTLIIPLQEAKEQADSFKQAVVSEIGDDQRIADLDEIDLPGFPEPREMGSAATTDVQTMLTEDYERLSEAYVFVEKCIGQRENVTQKEMLMMVGTKILETLCKMFVQGITSSSVVTRDAVNNLPNPGNKAERNERDYIFNKHTLAVLDSMITEYES